MANVMQPALFGEATPFVPVQRRKKPSKVRTVQATCKICLEPFTYRKVRRAQAFCSDLCRSISFRYDRIRVYNCCPMCGEWFPVGHNNAMLCGVKCLGVLAAMKARKVSHCKGCGDPFPLRKHKKKLFCSPECRYAQAYPRKCSGCDVEFITTSPRKKWCVDCQGTYRRDHLVRISRQGWDRLDYDLRNAYAELVRQRPCVYCGRLPHLVKIHVDHAIPLSRGGSDAWHNLVPACEPCNLKKHAKTPEEFLASLGR
ncbi:HNH endonuclease [Streptomyces sp. SID4982]|uniref:HNH endonuclease n=1 Tax=Streptomyces sp. SID4982 TaxID=2690291 RepID=UPI001926B4B1